MEGRMKELIAIGASITANCQPCLEYHVGKALEYGANEEEIKEAIETGRLVRSGATAKMDKLASQMAFAAPLAGSKGGEDCGCNM